ncbi:hypothetical protein, partial [Cronobacter sakazakii]|uniref:hypothetical protein n=1 Tax=Cronobacter sakazakii TaxID=28141 RepID=UPI000D49C1D5
VHIISLLRIGAPRHRFSAPVSTGASLAVIQRNSSVLAIVPGAAVVPIVMVAVLFITVEVVIVVHTVTCAETLLQFPVT